MLVDIHCHTMQTKSDGENDKRNVSKELFCEKVIKAKIKMLAITNHNLFNKAQFDEFKNAISKECYLLPGIEFNLKENNRPQPSHILVIVDPKYEDDFNEKIIELTNPKKEKTFSTNNFVITSQDLINNFKGMNPIFIPHYKKDPSITEETLVDLQEKCKENNIPILLEPSSVNSLTVFNSQGKKCIIGSDVIDWNQYEHYHFSDLTKNVSNYDQFHNLCTQNKPIVLDAISKTLIKKVTLFENEPSYSDFGKHLEVEPGTTIIFGDKGTGKTKLLATINSCLKSQGMNCNSFASSNSQDWLKSILKCDASTINLSALEISDALSESFKSIYNFIDSNPSAINSFLLWSKSNFNESKKSKLKILNMSNSQSSNRDSFLNYFKDAAKIKSFCKEMLNFSIYTDKSDEINEIIKSLYKLRDESLNAGRNNFIDFQANQFISSLKASYEKSFLKYTGKEMKPEIGFYKYCLGRINLNKKARQIKNTLDSQIKNEKEDEIGSLDGDRVIVKDEIGLLNDSIIKSLDSSKNLRQIKKTDFTNFSKFLCFVSSIRNCFSDSAIKQMDALKEKMKNDDDSYPISSLEMLLYERKKLIYSNKEGFELSSGQKSILHLQSFLKSLSHDQCIFIDEPEANLSPYYIRENIIPLLNDLTNQNKYVFIVTHNANIAILTNPVRYIFKEHIERNGYQTFYGDINTDLLINVSNSDDKLKLSEVLLKYLEGGVKAFKERGNKYGIKFIE